MQRAHKIISLLGYLSQVLTVLLLILVRTASGDDVNEVNRWQTLQRQRDDYRLVLDTVRKEHGGVRKLPAVDFYLFGMGARTKYVYSRGQLTNALTGELLKSWDLTEDLIVPPAYTVALRTKSGSCVYLVEDEEGIWMEADGKRESLSASRVTLPTFTDHRLGLVLRVLHQELLVNVVDGRPVPNLFVYPKPWYRDGAMMAMAFKRTNNVHLIKPWIENLRDPFDRNNGNETEADNPGQALYLVSLVSDKSHPLVSAAQQALRKFEVDGHIAGRSDFALHPVYQTKWAKFGLTSLGLADPYTLPQIDDGYATLFWWAYKDLDKAGQSVIVSDDYPYLTWAGCHTTGQTRGKLSDRDYPLTWEANASQAQYAGMNRISPMYAKEKICAPHTWHAAEAFLYLLDSPQ